ncbi:MAG: hypothetical protein LBB67_04560 [Oscillospiraceae bacterium]|jgi:hypothetical protein|nr:hypothetical protein [Oscillospiraceae bacterium]
MKTKRVLSVLMSLCVLLGISAFIVSALPPIGSVQPIASDYPLISDEDYYPEDYIGYVYPVRPGMIEWTELESGEDMTAACQIPQDVLADMSDEELLQTVAAYPLASDIFLLEDPAEGISRMCAVFNGLDALLKSSVDADDLLSQYSNNQSAVHEDALGDVNYRKMMANRRALFLEELLMLPTFFNMEHPLQRSMTEQS